MGILIVFPHTSTRHCIVTLQVARDCADILASGQHNSGVYTVRVNGNNLEVFCDMTTEGGGWLVTPTT